MSAVLKVLIVDDEPPARERVREFVEAEADARVIGVAEDVPQAIARIDELRPDIVFLDIQIPGGSGFDVAERSGGESGPAFVFATAFDQHALRAFEVQALDYLLKPFDRERFRRAFARAREDAAGRRNGGAGARADRLVVRSLGRVVFLKIEEIDYVEACGNYVRIFIGKDEHLLRETLQGLETRLDGRRFVRIHRSTLVNIERIRALEPLLHGDWSVHLQSGPVLTLSRSHRDRVRAILGPVF